ncbi:hypothetical protein NEOLEDRAFT_348851 [Neolentinus lepideus HHB14362 ss-1]|uniref:Uncharacterized protein n=1 Tax=Neolentinus lepideus HHB14362 ss-1 TaxID=1314782 RepID=A0A165SR98_9AGAM|nr:hypothetical protein NEOLEDRAFT_348851 [Neolentinus lepideus HHB14362 ss-1]
MRKQNERNESRTSRLKTTKKRGGRLPERGPCDSLPARDPDKALSSGPRGRRSHGNTIPAVLELSQIVPNPPLQICKNRGVCIPMTPKIIFYPHFGIFTNILHGTKDCNSRCVTGETMQETMRPRQNDIQLQQPKTQGRARLLPFKLNIGQS